MEQDSHTVWIASEMPVAAACCGSCASAHAGSGCDSDSPLPRCDDPHLEGPQGLLQQALHRLDQVREPGSPLGLVQAHLISALRLDGSEAELQLSFPMHCGSAMDLADEAFHALRAALPDTDIYVRHSA